MSVLHTKSDYNFALTVRKRMLDKIATYEAMRATLDADEIHAPAVGAYLADLRGGLARIDEEVDKYLKGTKVSASSGPVWLEEALRERRENEYERRRKGADVRFHDHEKYNGESWDGC